MNLFWHEACETSACHSHAKRSDTATVIGYVGPGSQQLLRMHRRMHGSVVVKGAIKDDFGLRIDCSVGCRIVYVFGPLESGLVKACEK